MTINHISVACLLCDQSAVLHRNESEFVVLIHNACYSPKEVKPFFVVKAMSDLLFPWIWSPSHPKFSSLAEEFFVSKGWYCWLHFLVLETSAHMLGGGEAPFHDEMLCHTAVHEQTKLPVKRVGRKWRAKEMHKNKNSICRLTKLREP